MSRKKVNKTGRKEGGKNEQQDADITNVAYAGFFPYEFQPQHSRNIG